MLVRLARELALPLRKQECSLRKIIHISLIMLEYLTFGRSLVLITTHIFGVQVLIQLTKVISLQPLLKNIMNSEELNRQSSQEVDLIDPKTVDLSKELIHNYNIRL